MKSITWIPHSLTLIGWMDVFCSLLNLEEFVQMAKQTSKYPSQLPSQWQRTKSACSAITFSSAYCVRILAARRRAHKSGDNQNDEELLRGRFFVLSGITSTPGECHAGFDSTVTQIFDFFGPRHQCDKWDPLRQSRFHTCSCSYKKLIIEMPCRNTTKWRQEYVSQGFICDCFYQRSSIRTVH